MNITWNFVGPIFVCLFHEPHKLLLVQIFSRTKLMTEWWIITEAFRTNQYGPERVSFLTNSPISSLVKIWAFFFTSNALRTDCSLGYCWRYFPLQTELSKLQVVHNVDVILSQKSEKGWIVYSSSDGILVSNYSEHYKGKKSLNLLQDVEISF